MTIDNIVNFPLEPAAVAADRPVSRSRGASASTCAVPGAAAAPDPDALPRGIVVQWQRAARRAHSRGPGHGFTVLPSDHPYALTASEIWAALNPRC